MKMRCQRGIGQGNGRRADWRPDWRGARRGRATAAIACSVACGVAGLATGAMGQGLNLLFYGNSYTYGYGSTRSVPQMVADIAGTVGYSTPYFVAATVGSSTLAYHNAVNTAVISTGLPAGQHWDHVIMQDQSEICTRFGSVALHRSSYVSLLGKVRLHSPNAVGIGYQTWSRAPDFPYFTAPNPPYPGGPAEMTAQIKNGYDLSTADAIAAYGEGASKVARVGEAWQAANWDRLHIADMSHAQNRGSLLAAMVIYSTIYDDPTLQDIDYTELVNLLLLTPTDAAYLSAAAQRAIGTVTPGNEIYWTNVATGATVAWRTDDSPEDGEFVIGAVTLSNNDDTRWKLCARADLNLDGAMDLIWRHSSSGETRAWLMRGGETLRVVALPTVEDTRWELRATPDVDLDGIADFLWRSSAGENVVWRMGPPSGSGDNFTPGAIVAIESLPAVRDPYWQIEGSADFNGDDKPDVLWRNVRTGATAAWLMNGVAYASSVNITPSVGDVNARVVAIADYDHDGKSDLVWRNLLTGAMELWLMDGVTRRAVVAMPTVGDSAWRTLGQGAFAGSGGSTRDFDGDGHADLLWRHKANGQNALWLMRDGAFSRLVSLETIADANWTIAAVWDLTRDNKPDVLWRNSATGHNVLWIMDGASRRASVELPRVSKTAWSVGAIADVDGDQTNDLVWVDASTGQSIAWVLDGTPEDQTWVRSLVTMQEMPTRHVMLGSGRFFTDGTYDLIVQDLDAPTNELARHQAWIMRGSQRVAVGSLPLVGDADWRIGAVADFNRDGTTDLLWRHAATGENLLWRMRGSEVMGVVELPRVGDVGWEVAR